MFEPKLHVTVEPYDTAHQAQVVRLSGDFDKIGLEHVRDTFTSLSETFAGKYLIFDCEQLQFINSEGIGFLVGLYTHVKNKGGIFCLVKARDHVRDVFEALGLWNIIQHPDSIEACYNLS